MTTRSNKKRVSRRRTELQRINALYGTSYSPGDIITFQGHDVEIISGKSAFLKVKLLSDTQRVFEIHPTWDIETSAQKD